MGNGLKLQSYAKDSGQIKIALTLAVTSLSFIDHYTTKDKENMIKNPDGLILSCELEHNHLYTGINVWSKKVQVLLTNSCSISQLRFAWVVIIIH